MDQGGIGQNVTAGDNGASRSQELPRRVSLRGTYFRPEVLQRISDFALNIPSNGHNREAANGNGTPSAPRPADRQSNGNRYFEVIQAFVTGVNYERVERQNFERQRAEQKKQKNLCDHLVSFWSATPVQVSISLFGVIFTIIGVQYASHSIFFSQFEKIQQVEDKLTAKIEKLEKSEQIKNVEDKLTAKIEKIEDKLTAKIEKIEDRLTSKIKELEENLKELLIFKSSIELLGKSFPFFKPFIEQKPTSG